MLGIAAAVAVLVFLAQGLEELMAFLAELGERSGVPETLFVPLYKTLGIALVVRVGAGLWPGRRRARPWEAWWKPAGAVCAMLTALAASAGCAGHAVGAEE